MTRLALLGGERVVGDKDNDVAWPVVTDDDRRAVLRTLDSGLLVSNAAPDTEVSALEREWAEFTGTAYAVGLSSGTAAIGLALMACGIEPGAEVIVPALSFNASGLAALQHLVVPVFADIDPVSFNLRPDAVEAAISPRTAAILAVHLHGLPADMDALGAIASRHGLALVEDAAQAHGARLGGRQVGGLGRAGCFSLNYTKNLPACGEGGLLTTDDEALAAEVTRRREFGERFTTTGRRDYVATELGWNHKLNCIQAAFTRSQLARFEAYDRERRRNVERLLGRLADLPGVVVPTTPPDRTHAYHILRFRFDPAAAGLDGVAPGAFRTAVQKVLRAEGVPLSTYQDVPLSEHGAFQPGGAWPAGLPWTLGGAGRRPPPDVPVCRAVLADSLTLQRRHLNPSSGPLLDRYATAFEKVWEQLDFVGTLAGAAKAGTAKAGTAGAGGNGARGTRVPS